MNLAQSIVFCNARTPLTCARNNTLGIFIRIFNKGSTVRIYILITVQACVVVSPSLETFRFFSLLLKQDCKSKQQDCKSKQ